MKVERLNPVQLIPGMANLSLADFWSWAYSDVLSNGNRAVFAEFMVGAALGLLGTPRVEWDSVDFRYRGFGVEVKSSAYVQSWPQTRLSRIEFGIEKKRGWDAATNKASQVPVRASDVYVFCLYPEKDRGRCNVLDSGAWEFYVVATGTVEHEFRDQKAVGLARIREVAEAVSYTRLRLAVNSILESLGSTGRKPSLSTSEAFARP